MLSLDARILQALRLATTHLSGAELAAAAGARAEEVPAAMARLLDAALPIEQHVHLGYRLVAESDLLLADDLSGRLQGCSLVREILVFASTGSTNDVAARLGREGAAGGLVIFAEQQTAGRGRFGRAWVSPPGAGIWVSLVLRPELPAEKWHRLTLAAALAVRAALARVAGLEAELKWPNDVFVRQRKIAGVLVESFLDRDGRRFAVLGIGVNVHQVEFPPELRLTATSLQLATGQPVARPALAAELLWSLARKLSLLKDAEFSNLIREAESCSVLLGREVETAVGGAWTGGVAESLDGEGFLRVRTPAGTLITLHSGEVSARVAR